MGWSLPKGKTSRVFGFVLAEMCGLTGGGWGQQALPVQILAFQGKRVYASKYRVVPSRTRASCCAPEESREFFGGLPMGDGHGKTGEARVPLLECQVLTPTLFSTYSAVPE